MALPMPVLQVPLLPHVGGGFFPWPQGRLRFHVSLRWCSYDCILLYAQYYWAKVLSRHFLSDETHPDQEGQAFKAWQPCSLGAPARSSVSLSSTTGRYRVAW